EKWGAIRADRYHVERVLASGAQGRILLARHRHLDQRCVIKLVASDDETWSEVANQRLRNEAQAGVRVNHPNVARVFDCDCVDHSWYFVMEYIRGDNLRRVIQHVRYLPPTQVVEIGRQAASGLMAIHRGGLIHRDIKPSNLMLSADGTVKIMDLGLVKLLNTAEGMGVTHAGQVVGTPLYMPPEQFDASEQVDARSDIYALGATLYHLATGHPPYDGGDFKEVAHRHRHEPLRWSDDDRKRVPQWLRDVVESCLAKRREHRIASAAILERALREHESTSRPAAIELPAAPEGVAVMAFKNLSRQASDEWIGDAIAEYVASRLMEFDGLHVADRNVLARIICQTSDDSVSEPSREQIIEAARLVGVGYVIVGSYQCQADQIRITAQSMSQSDTHTRHLTTTSGSVAALFDLEDLLTDRIISALGPALPCSRRRSGPSGVTSNPKAHEQYVRGQRAFVEGDYQAAIARAEEAASLDPDYDEPISLIGACYARLGDYDRAVEYHHRQERRASESDDPVNLASALGNLGAMYYYKGEYAVAYDFLDRAAALSDEDNQTPDTAKLYGNLGMVLTRLEKTEQASAAFERAIEICKKFNDIVSMVWPYNGMGSLLLKQKRYTEAREYHQRALTLAQEIGDRVMVGVAQMNIGRCACLMTDFEEAGIWFNAALGSLERTKFWNGLTLVYEHLAEMHLLESKPQDALGCIDKRIELAGRHGNKRMESQAWEQKARAYEQMKRTGEALEALKTSLAVSQRPEPYESLHRYLEEIAHRKPLR
ncbi:MAG: tetratricopeptide repeat protein, partial [Phycisphaerae bacterium]